MTKATRRLQAIPSSASPEEAAAIVAALERFMRATAPPPRSHAARTTLDGWQRTALLEGVSRAPAADADAADVPWISPIPG
jgi:hypothetical protein